MPTQYRITPMDALKDGDEFVRIANYPVLLKDIPGKREGDQFTPDYSGRRIPVHHMEMQEGGWLKEIAAPYILDDEEEP
ncbi:MAG: hypothetical protein ABIY70_08735 [Capsulimonas sp.]|uniref:hypothetical protein n=1 Tax=Capsulimonas sp. TaxID=2494211 RepID=UPI003264E3E0